MELETAPQELGRLLANHTGKFRTSLCRYLLEVREVNGVEGRHDTHWKFSCVANTSLRGIVRTVSMTWISPPVKSISYFISLIKTLRICL
jgi:hypothetical protein